MAEDEKPGLPAHLRDDLKFKPGQSGNPAGRPKGARSRLGEEFLQDMLADWEKNGAATIEKVRIEKPDQYLKVVASTIPKELNIKVNELDDLTDDQLARQLRSIAAQLAAAGIDLVTRDGPETPPEPASGLSTLQ